MAETDLDTKLGELMQVIANWDQVIHIGYAYSADALIAAAIIGKTMIDRDHPFVIFQFNDILKELEERGDHPYILLGGDAYEVPAYESLVWITEPSDREYDDSRVVNVTSFNMSRPEISISAVSYLLCLELASDPQSLIHLPLVAEQAVSMKKEPQGVHQQILDLAEEGGLVSRKITINVFGSDVFDIIQALVYSQDPFFPNLTDNKTKVVKFLNKEGIVAETNEGPRKFSDLSDEELKKLNIALIKYLSTNSGYRQGKLNFIGSKTIVHAEDEFTILYNTWDYAQSILDCLNNGKEEIALAVLLGNRSKYLRELTKLFEAERQILGSAFRFLKPDDIEELKSLRYIKTSSKIDWYNAMSIAAMALASGLATIDLPLVALCPGPNDHVTLGIRASTTLELPKRLDQIMAHACSELGLEVKVAGDEFGAQVSVPGKMAEDVVLQINKKLGENIEIQH